MQYTKFEIKNFKGIKDLTLDLTMNPKFKIFTFVGLNESGKTSILDAISFFQEDFPAEKRHTLIPKSKKTNFNGYVSVKATLSLEKKDEEMIKNYAKSINFDITQDIKTISVEKQYIFEKSRFSERKDFWRISLIGKKKRSRSIRKLNGKNEIWQPITSYIKKELFPAVIYYPNFLFDFPPRIYLEPVAKESEEQEFYRQVLQDILDSLKGELSLKEHIVDRMKSTNEEDKEALDATTHKMGSKITSTVFSVWETLFKSRGREIIIKPNRETTTEGTRYYIEIKVKEGSEEYQVSEKSLGFTWFFAFLLFTEFRKNRVADKGEILFLLDEPASNLHSTAQAKLLDTFHTLVSKSKLIYATHSHHLINTDWLEGAFIVQNRALDYENEFDYDSSKTDIVATPYRQFVAQSPEQQTYFQPILDKLEYKPSRLELVPNIVIVEGKNDFYTFKYINEVILGNKPDLLHFYPGRGAGKNDQVIRLYVNWGRRFVIFEDGDEAGEKGKEKYIREIGDIIKDKIFIISDIDKKWKGFCTENLFSEKEKLEIIQAIFPSAKTQSKQKLNKAIQNLLFLRQPVSLNKTTKKRFEKIFKFLKERLNQK